MYAIKMLLFISAIWLLVCMFISLWGLKSTLTWRQLHKCFTCLISPNKNSFQNTIKYIWKEMNIFTLWYCFYSRYLLVHIPMFWILYTFNNAWNTFLIFNFINVEFYFYTILLPCLFSNSTYVFLVYFNIFYYYIELSFWYSFYLLIIWLNFLFNLVYILISF